MARYIPQSRIRQAVERLGKSAANQSLIDFLILARVLQLQRNDGGLRAEAKERVVLSMENQRLVQAIQELMAHGMTGAEYGRYPYLNPYGTASHSSQGYRTVKYPSNGTPDTVTQPEWTQQITELLQKGPRVVRLRAQYVNHLSDFMLEKGKGDRPRIDDSAVWFFRSRDVEAFSGNTSKDTLHNIVLAYVDALGLTRDDIAAIFDPTESVH